MARFDVTYTNGVIAAREKYLLKDKIFRLCELTAEEAFRLLLDCGYGGGAETATSVYEYEKLIAVEEEKLDAFIREYAPSDKEAAYLLSPRDFHNAKALIKASYLEESAERMLAPQGLIPVETLSACVKENDYRAIASCPRLKEACENAVALLHETPSGAKLGEIFEKALYTHLRETVKRGTLKKLLSAKADMTNILIAFRAGSAELVAGKYLPSGTLTEKQLATLFDADTEKAKKAFQSTPYAEFVKICFSAKEKGLPFTEAEKILGGYDTAYFARRKYDLQKSEPFLYYAYRRRAENANVRIAFVCLLAGLSERDIKRRLRVF